MDDNDPQLSPKVNKLVKEKSQIEEIFGFEETARPQEAVEPKPTVNNNTTDAFLPKLQDQFPMMLPQQVEEP